MFLLTSQLIYGMILKIGNQCSWFPFCFRIFPFSSAPVAIISHFAIFIFRVLQLQEPSFFFFIIPSLVTRGITHTDLFPQYCKFFLLPIVKKKMTWGCKKHACFGFDGGEFMGYNYPEKIIKKWEKIKWKKGNSKTTKNIIFKSFGAT